MKTPFFYLLICFLMNIHLFAQQNQYATSYFKAQGHFGYVMQHRNSISNLINSHIYGFQLDWAKLTTGDKLWHHENNFPEAGLSAHFYTLGNQEKLGQLIAFAPYYDIGLNKQKKTSCLYMRLSCGTAVATKKFDPLLNHKNNVISSKLNVFINFKWYYKMQISKKLRIDAGLNFAHASNGRFKTPNLGVNLLTVNTGLTYIFENKKTIPKSEIDSSYVAKSNHEFIGIAAIGINEIYPPGGNKFLAQSYTFGYNYNKRNTHKFGGGLDFFYCQSTKQELYDTDSIWYSSNIAYLQTGLRLSYSYVIGQVSLPVEFGYYIQTKFKGNGLFYHRIGLRYHFKNNLMLTFSLKSHWAVAHCFEFGAGYRLFLLKDKRKADSKSNL